METPAGDTPHVGAYVVEGANAPSKTKQLTFAVRSLVNPGVGEEVPAASSSEPPDELVGGAAACKSRHDAEVADGFDEPPEVTSAQGSVDAVVKESAISSVYDWLTSAE